MSHCSGTTEYSSSGGSVKRVHAGIGTRDGIRSAEMAAAGITGPTAFLTGAKGFVRTFVEREVEEESAGAFALDRPFEIERIWFKPYCCCGIIHGYIDGARQLAARPADVDVIDLGIQTGGNVVVGNRNANTFASTSIENLQYSLPFQFALALLGRGNGFTTHRDFTRGSLDVSDGSEPAKLASRIRITPDPALDKAHPGKWVADITVTHHDGTRESVFVDSPNGTAENPMSRSDLDAKFGDLTVAGMGAERSEAVLRAVTGGDLSTSASAMVELLVA